MKKLPKLYEWGTRFPKTVLGIVFALTLASLFFSSKLKIINDLTELLPKSFESVQALRDLKQYFGGQGFLLLAVEGQDSSQTEAFADEFAKKIEGLPQVRYVEYRRPVEFFKKRLWLYFEEDD